MWRVEFERHGAPAEVARIAEAADPGDPGPGEVLVDIRAFPINPADLLTLQGLYAGSPELPATLGAEAIGEVAAVGDLVSGLAVGDRVILLSGNNWRQRRRLDQRLVIKAPAGAPLVQLAMLKVNPATAWLLLERFHRLQPGDWVLQNAGGSAVGRLTAQLAARRGVRIVSLLRDPNAVHALTPTGTEALLTGDADFRSRLLEITGGVDPKLSLDAVAGRGTEALADATAEGGSVVVYGGLSGEPCRLRPDQFIFRDVRLRGFWLTRHVEREAHETLAQLYGDIGALVAEGALVAPVDSEFPLSRLREAMARAQAPGRNGKVIVVA